MKSFSVSGVAGGSQAGCSSHTRFSANSGGKFVSASFSGTRRLERVWTNLHTEIFFVRTRPPPTQAEETSSRLLVPLITWEKSGKGDGKFLRKLFGLHSLSAKSSRHHPSPGGRR
jgi:hypothetical protein